MPVGKFNFGGGQGSTPAKRMVLTDRFLIGEELGRGAYGQVFKGKDTITGDVVAIKQISLTGVSQETLQSVMGEIDLLKTLHHRNIVKYLGSFKTKTHLYIILEYMENGALSSLIKPNRFGVFPEALAAVYIAQVLQGLQYLHDQGVVHRDIKGANILTTKEGVVKLADFGVAAKLGELEEGNDDLQQNVVGTPYWMAPEVIEMTAVTAASDIWSVGCLIIELLTGYPPNYDLQPMSALFRIVQDDHPPMPDIASPLMQDFLLLCFQKDPKLRPTAAQLLRHEWLQHNRRTLRSSWGRGSGFKPRDGKQEAAAHETVNSVVARMLAAEEDEGVSSTGSRRATPVKVLHDSASTVRATASPPSPPVVPPLPSGAKLKSVPAHDGDRATLDPSQVQTVLPGGTRPASAKPADTTTTTSITGITSPRKRPSSAPPTAAPVAATAAAATAAAAAAAAVSASDSAASGSTSSPPALPLQANSSPGALTQELPALSEADEELITPRTAEVLPLLSTSESPVGAADAVARARKPPKPDVSDAELHQRRQAHHGASTSDAGFGGWTTPRELGTLSQRRTHSRDGSHDAAGGTLRRKLSGMETPLQEFFERLQQESRSPAPGAGVLQRDGSRTLMTWTEPERRGPSGSPLHSVERSAASDRTDDATMELKREIRSLVAAMRPVAAPSRESGAPQPLDACGRMVSLLTHSPENKQAFLAENGAMVLLELMDCEANKLLEVALDLARELTSGDPRILEGLCMLGYVPQVCKLTDPKWPNSLRTKAAALVQNMCFASSATLQVFIACQGLRYLVGMVQDVLPGPSSSTSSSGNASAEASASVTHVAVTCVCRVLHTQGGGISTQQRCRLFAQLGLITKLAGLLKQLLQLQSKAASMHPLSLAASSGVRDSGHSETSYLLATGTSRQGSALMRWDAVGALPAESTEALLGRVVELLMMLSHADVVVKGFLAGRDVLQQLLDSITKLHHGTLAKMMHCLSSLSKEPSMLSALKDAGAINVLVPLLGKEREGLGLTVQREALNTLFNICKVNKKVHYDLAASAGIIPHLCRFAMMEEPPDLAPDAKGRDAMSPESSAEDRELRAASWRSDVRSLVVQMLIGMVTSSSTTRAKLWAQSGLDTLLNLLADEGSGMQAMLMRAVDQWLAEDTSRVEARLTQERAVQQVVAVFASTARSSEQAQVLPQLLESLRSMVGRSARLAVALVQGGLVTCMLAMLHSAVPLVQRRVLDILRSLYEHFPRPKEFLLKFKISEELRKLTSRGDEAVRNEAQVLLSAFNVNVLL